MMCVLDMLTCRGPLLLFSGMTLNRSTRRQVTLKTGSQHANFVNVLTLLEAIVVEVPTEDVQQTKV